MKYVITGSTGHVSKPITEALVKAGHDVSVVTSNPAKSSEIESLGARALVGSVDDEAFLTAAFKDADLVYTMVPPKWDPTDWKEYIAKIGRNYANALRSAKVKKVVNLSSIGADLPSGCGPVSGLHQVEKALNELPGTDVKHLRPAYFYDNLLSNIGMIKTMNIMGANFKADSLFPLVDTGDIANAAIPFLLNPDFTGKSVAYIVSDITTPAAITQAIGAAIGKPDLSWMEFSDEQSLGGMKQAGLNEEVAKNYTEMGAAIRSGMMMSDYVKQGKPVIGKVKVHDFAKRFAEIYKEG